MRRALGACALVSIVAACASQPSPAPEPIAAPAIASPVAPQNSIGAPPASVAKPPPVVVAIEPAGVRELRAARAHVQVLDPGRGTLWIDFAAAKELDDEALARLLEPVKEHAAHLGLARTKAGPRTLSVAATMPNLERLDLSGTPVGTRALAELGAHPKLATLVVTNAKLDSGAVEVLTKLPALVELHAWRSGLDSAALERMKAARPTLRVDSAAAAPRKPVETESDVKLVTGRSAPAPSPAPAEGAPKPVNTTCPVSGTAVDAAYSIVFEGRVVGFCCSNCPTKFWADPAAYRAKLP